ncbi:hypothetical protein V1478_002557 [Vespula squamosa]|uniref:Uncharacterized protein n=1 Tax=Vespula squamosa TaxID=30214 RepID=A0ABD2BUC7_VESSQ
MVVMVIVLLTVVVLVVVVVDDGDGGCTLSGKMVIPLLPNKNGFYGTDNVSVPCEDEPGENSINSLTCGMGMGRRN